MKIGTPLGDILTFADADSFGTLRKVPAERRGLGNSVEWACWSTPSAVAEVFVGPYVPKLPSHMSVDGCWAALWRVQAIHALAGCAIVCQWHVLPAGAKGGPNSGQDLDAQTWRAGSTLASIGTEDDVSLANRAKRGFWIPARLAPEYEALVVEYLDGGLRVPIPALEAGESVQIHFLIAWVNSASDDSVDTWFAVEQPHSEVLRQLGVS